jgi:hypothetical protein
MSSDPESKSAGTPEKPVAKPKRVRERKKPQTALLPAEDTAQGGEDPCPPTDPQRGPKTPSVIRWNLRHRPGEMETIYRGWDWQAYLDSEPEEYPLP